MSAAFELAPFGITANMVYPPVTDTGWVTGTIREYVAASPGLIHIATPGEVAESSPTSLPTPPPWSPRT